MSSLNRSYAMNVEALEKKLDEATPLTHKAAGIPPEYAILPRESVRQLAQEFKALRALMLGCNDPALLPGMFEIGKRLIALDHVVDRYARHDQLCHTLDRESLATFERVCTCGLEDALATVHMGK